jgi:hypothetical protein
MCCKVASGAIVNITQLSTQFMYINMKKAKITCDVEVKNPMNSTSQRPGDIYMPEFDVFGDAFLDVSVEPFILALTLYILVHTSLVSARDILVTFGGKKLVIPQDPNRAVLKKNIRKHVRPGVLGMIPRAGIIPPNVSLAPRVLMPVLPQVVDDNVIDSTSIKDTPTDT